MATVRAFFFSFLFPLPFRPLLVGEAASFFNTRPTQFHRFYWYVTDNEAQPEPVPWDYE